MELRELFSANKVKLTRLHTRRYGAGRIYCGDPRLDMENKIFLGKYRISGARDGASVETRRSLAGVAYEAEDIITGGKVTVELIPAASVRTAVRTQLEGEAFAAKQLCHINIPKLYDFGLDDDQLVYVTEYFDGTTTEAWVRAHGPLAIDPVLRIALQVVSALGAAAFHKIFHHAINPSNLMIVPGQTVEGDWPLVKVLHFAGVAPTFSASDVSTAHFDNSAAFASPEQLEHGTVDFRSEIFSLGCTLWFLFTGAAPFAVPGDPVEVAPTRMSLAVERLTGIPKKVRALLAQMLAANPEERPLDPIALEAEIRECLAEVERREAISHAIGIPAILGTFAVESPIRRRALARMLALAAVLLVVAIIAAMIVPDFRPSRILQALGRPAPIGVPIGIPEPETKPAIARGENEAQPNASHGEAATTSKGFGATPANVATGNAIISPAATAPPAAASANQIAATPIPSGSLNPSVNATPAQRPVPLVASEVPTVAKRTEPAPPAEGPGQVATVKTGKSSGLPSANEASATPMPARLPDPPDSAAAAEGSGDVAATDSTGSSSPVAASSNLEQRKITPSVASRARATTRSVVRSRRDVTRRRYFALDEPVYEGGGPRLSRRFERPRFVGTTPDGWWMLELPSHRIVVVPPPPGY
jgi:serine/threonine-protein kinase